MSAEKIAVLGLGLIGGSIAAGARLRGIRPVVGWDPNPEACAVALARGYVDAIELTPGDAVDTATLVIAACPVPQVASLLLEVAQDARQGTLLTDVGSTKNSIMAGLRSGLPPGVEFIGSHPLAGSEKSGPTHSDPNLVEGKVVAVCPEEKTTQQGLERLEGFWKALGAKVVRCPGDRHDALLSLTSHLPHLLAYLLAAMPDEEHAPYLAGGFRDMTRLAASSPHLWMGIFQDNREELLKRAKEFRASLETAIEALENPEDTQGFLQGVMEKGWKMRTSWQA